jgi:hypothetical protein
VVCVIFTGSTGERLRPLRAADGRDYSMQRRDPAYLSAAIDEGGLSGAATNVR